MWFGSFFGYYYRMGKRLEVCLTHKDKLVRQISQLIDWWGQNNQEGIIDFLLELNHEVLVDRMEGRAILADIEEVILLGVSHNYWPLSNERTKLEKNIEEFRKAHSLVVQIVYKFTPPEMIV